MQAPLPQSLSLLVTALTLWIAAPSQAAPIANVGDGGHAPLMGSYDAATGNYWAVSYDSLDDMTTYSGKMNGKSFSYAMDASTLTPGAVVYPAAPARPVRRAVVPEPSGALLAALSLLAVQLRSRRRQAGARWKPLSRVIA